MYLKCKCQNLIEILRISNHNLEYNINHSQVPRSKRFLIVNFIMKMLVISLEISIFVCLSKTYKTTLSNRVNTVFY